MDPGRISLYHLTHVANLPSILDRGGIGCLHELRQRRIPRRSIAHDTIQSRRRVTPVPCGPGGVLHDYVPFFFAPKSPMLFTLNKGNVPGHPGGQEPLIHLRTTVAAVIAERRSFVFTDGHATMALTTFFDDPAHLSEVDWNVIWGEYWHDTPDDPDRKRRRQAEFLVRHSLPWRLVREIGVYSDVLQVKVEQEIVRVGHKPPVVVRPKWYY